MCVVRSARLVKLNFDPAKNEIAIRAIVTKVGATSSIYFFSSIGGAGNNNPLSLGERE